MPCSALIAVPARCLSTPLFLELRFIGRHDLIPTFASLLDVLSPVLGRCVYFSAFTINSHITDFLFGRLAGVAAASIQHLHLNVIPVDLSAQRRGHPIPVVFTGVLPSLTSYTLRNGFLDWKDPPFYWRIHHLWLDNQDTVFCPALSDWAGFFRSMSSLVVLNVENVDCSQTHLILRIFRAWNPAVHTFYETTLDVLHLDNSSLHRNFDRSRSTFAAATINFGPKTGWCAITALGDFNPDRGGHLVLWDLKLVIRFPPGSTILIPSAILRHSNVNIAEGEKRYSFTQFTAAGLFRWVDNGFKSDVTVNQELAAQNNTATAAARLDAWHTRWVNGVNSFKHCCIGKGKCNKARLSQKLNCVF
ncbi:hypothetical protein K438DRAFT_1770690 [Mycena galopus ATCC 62051]|nr:hypothetical protein K438DRAFT_1770690 [Mycena galopus ATCC 62051]